MPKFIGIVTLVCLKNRNLPDPANKKKDILQTVKSKIYYWDRLIFDK